MAFHGSTRKASAPRLTSWSFSRLKTYLQCPYKAKLLYIDRMKEPESAPMLEGHRIHKLAEDFLKGIIEDVPEELELFAEDYYNLRDCGSALYVESNAAFRKDLTPCDWFAKDAWLRAIYDALVVNDDGTAIVIDLKTGKMRREDSEQLSLFAFTILLKLPEINEVRTELWYAKGGELVSGDYTRTGFNAYREYWLSKVEPMLADTEFLPNPSALCRWCHFRKDNNGPCKF